MLKPCVIKQSCAWGVPGRAFALARLMKCAYQLASDACSLPCSVPVHLFVSVKKASILYLCIHSPPIPGCWQNKLCRGLHMLGQTLALAAKHRTEQTLSTPVREPVEAAQRPASAPAAV